MSCHTGVSRWLAKKIHLTLNNCHAGDPELLNDRILWYQLREEGLKISIFDEKWLESPTCWDDGTSCSWSWSVRRCRRYSWWTSDRLRQGREEQELRTSDQHTAEAHLDIKQSWHRVIIRTCSKKSSSHTWIRTVFPLKLFCSSGGRKQFLVLVGYQVHPCFGISFDSSADCSITNNIIWILDSGPCSCFLGKLSSIITLSSFYLVSFNYFLSCIF